MLDTLLRTKLYIPPVRPNLVPRPRLIERLNQGLQLGHKLTLISAPAGFGKTTLAAEWLTGCGRPVAWLSLDEGESDPARFLSYIVAALRSLAQNGEDDVMTTIGESMMLSLQTPQPPVVEALLTSLLNEITAVGQSFILVFDDYHLVDSRPVDTSTSVDDALAFLVEHLPPNMHLAVVTREDPHIPLPRLRARGQLTELRVADLRFTLREAAAFLNQVMGFNLSEEEINALEKRTEGWVAGLQMAALSMQGRADKASFIHAFTGSHHFVLDYLLEEVLHQQPAGVQDFLLRTSILDRLCGPLCDAVLLDPAVSGQETLEYLAVANLFLIPLDDDRRWYRYHHLFADLLQQRLQQQADKVMAELHSRASHWYEENDLEIEAFQHAAAANDIERAARLVEGQGMPLHYRGAMLPVMDWLASLPTAEMDARPSLWVMYATALTITGQEISSVERVIELAEAALQAAAPGDDIQDLIGQMAAIRAMLAIPQYQTETIAAQSRRALKLLHPDNLPARTGATWTLGYAYQTMGDRAAARRTIREAMAMSQASGNIMFTLAASTSLGQIEESENQLYAAADSYRLVKHLAGDPPLPAATEAYLGLARIHYEWNELDIAQENGQTSLRLARQMANVDTPAACMALLARLRLSRGDLPGTAALLAEAEQFMSRRNFVDRMQEIAAGQVLTSLRRGNLTAAAELAERYDLPASQARVHLAQGDPAAALALLEPLRKQVETVDRPDELLKVMVLQVVALQARGNIDEAVQLLSDALALAEPGGFIRTFVDEGPPMARLLSKVHTHGIVPDYTSKLMAAFSTGGSEQPDLSQTQSAVVEPLSDREIEVLQLIAEGLTNQEIANRLYLSLHTVKVHARNIYAKLGVKNRTQAVARARELEILPSN